MSEKNCDAIIKICELLAEIEKEIAMSVSGRAKIKFKFFFSVTDIVTFNAHARITTPIIVTFDPWL